ncbi:heat shock cognate 70 kda protein 2, partial [Nicotiana attenuata]
MKLWPIRIIPGPGDNIMIVVNYKNEEKQFDAEEISSTMLTKIKEFAKACIGSTVTNVAVNVTAYFTYPYIMT